MRAVVLVILHLEAPVFIARQPQLQTEAVRSTVLRAQDRIAARGEELCPARRIPAEIVTRPRATMRVDDRRNAPLVGRPTGRKRQDGRYFETVPRLVRDPTRLTESLRVDPRTLTADLCEREFRRRVDQVEGRRVAVTLDAEDRAACFGLARIERQLLPGKLALQGREGRLPEFVDEHRLDRRSRDLDALDSDQGVRRRIAPEHHTRDIVLLVLEQGLRVKLLRGDVVAHDAREVRADIRDDQQLVGIRIEPLDLDGAALLQRVAQRRVQFPRRLGVAADVTHDPIGAQGGRLSLRQRDFFLDQQLAGREVDAARDEEGLLRALADQRRLIAVRVIAINLLDAALTDIGAFQQNRLFVVEHVVEDADGDARRLGIADGVVGCAATLQRLIEALALEIRGVELASEGLDAAAIDFLFGDEPDTFVAEEADASRTHVLAWNPGCRLLERIGLPDRDDRPLLAGRSDEAHHMLAIRRKNHVGNAFELGQRVDGYRSCDRRSGRAKRQQTDGAGKRSRLEQ